MNASLAGIWRHPIKALGRECIDEVRLSAGAWLPGDRVWAVAHARSKPITGWMHKMNFLRGVTAPELMAVTARLHESGRIDLTHPQAGDISIRPDNPDDWPILEEWLAAIWSDELPKPVALVKHGGVHMTDVPEPWISINSLSSHGAVEGRVGKDISIHRWRGNLWIDGLGPWEEFEWVGRRIRIGGAVVRIEERITRCKATMANPETGRRDIDTLAALETWDHQDFGVYGVVLEGGQITVGDPLEVIAT